MAWVEARSGTEPGRRRDRLKNTGVREPVDGALDDLERVGEAVRAPVVGVRHVVVLRGAVELAQQPDLVGGAVVGGEDAKVGGVLPVQRDHQVDALAFNLLELGAETGASKRETDQAYSRHGKGPFPPTPAEADRRAES